MGSREWVTREGGLNSSKNAETDLPELGFSKRRAGSLIFE
jgi:hypothetical protein